MIGKRFYYWLLAAIILIVFSVTARTQQPVNKSNDRRTPIPSALPLSTSPPAPTVVAEEVFCERPYSGSSVWNVPIDWSIARVHPMSDSMMDAFFERDKWIGADTSQYTPNVYLATNETPLVPVKLREYRFRDAIDDVQLQYGEPAGTVMMPLPPDAQPAHGTDGQLVVINVDTGEEWGLNEGSIDAGGNWLAGGVYRYSLENSGIPPEGFGQRGAGIGQLAGIVRRCEVDRGQIGHAVTLAYDYPCAPDICQLNGWPAAIAPFRKTDGKGESRFDLPEGTRIAIRPEISEREITRACRAVKGCVLWVLNMQQYGGFVVDNSGHPKTYAEGDATANWDASVWREEMLSHIPGDWYVVIDWNHPSTKVTYR